MASACFLQGDLKGAAAAFEKVTEADPDNPDGWVNIGRCAVQEGDMARARRVLEKALAISPNLARANFFYAKVLRTDGNYEGARRAFAPCWRSIRGIAWPSTISDAFSFCSASTTTP